MAQTQMKALNALATTRNLSEAAEKAGISRKTLYHYIHNVYEFATAYREMLNWQLAQTMDDLQQRHQRVQLCRVQNDSILHLFFEFGAMPAALKKLAFLAPVSCFVLFSKKRKIPLHLAKGFK